MFFFFQAEDGIRDRSPSRGLGDVYKRQIYLRAKGYSRCEIADIARVDEDTVTNHVKIFADSGLQGLLKANYYKPKSQLEPYVEQLKKLFEKNPPHTVNHAIELIFEQTGVGLKHSACQAFLKKMSMKC